MLDNDYFAKARKRNRRTRIIGFIIIGSAIILSSIARYKGYTLGNINYRFQSWGSTNHP